MTCIIKFILINEILRHNQTFCKCRPDNPSNFLPKISLENKTVENILPQLLKMNITELQNKLSTLNKLISEATGIIHDNILTDMILLTAIAQIKIQNGDFSEVSAIERDCEESIQKLKTLINKS